MDNETTTILAVVSIISSLGAFFTVFLKYIRHSECCKGFCECDTRDANTPTTTTPILKKTIKENNV